nr:DNA-binding protein WhiA [Sulfobacillus harzensis]
MAGTPLGSLPCCWAELWGLSGRVSDPYEDGGPWVEAGSAFVSRRAYRLMKHLDLDPSIHIGRHTHRVTFSLWGNDVPPPDLDQSLRDCPAGLVRGAFLMRGYVSEIDRPVHFEIQAAGPRQSETLAWAVEALGVVPHTSSRRSQPLIYLKDREQVAYLLGRLGAHQTVLAIQSQSVVKSMKNQINRLVNSETANMKRSVESGLKDAEKLSALGARGRLSRLPENLRELAEARVAHPEWSFEELGRNLHPPISKSAVNHRLRRLRLWLEQESENR